MLPVPRDGAGAQVTAEPGTNQLSRPGVAVADRPELGGSQGVIWQTVRKNWATALLTVLAVTLAVTFYTLGQTKILSGNGNRAVRP